MSESVSIPRFQVMARRKLATAPKAVIVVRKRVGAALWKLRVKGLPP